MQINKKQILVSKVKRIKINALALLLYLKARKIKKQLQHLFKATKIKEQFLNPIKLPNNNHHLLNQIIEKIL